MFAISHYARSRCSGALARALQGNQKTGFENHTMNIRFAGASISASSAAVERLPSPPPPPSYYPFIRLGSQDSIWKGKRRSMFDVRRLLIWRWALLTWTGWLLPSDLTNPICSQGARDPSPKTLSVLKNNQYYTLSDLAKKKIILANFKTTPFALRKDISCPGPNSGPGEGAFLTPSH